MSAEFVFLLGWLGAICGVLWGLGLIAEIIAGWRNA